MNIKDVIAIMTVMGVFNMLCVFIGYFVCSHSRIINIVEGQPVNNSLNKNSFSIKDLLNRVKGTEYKEEEAFVPDDM